MLLKKKTWKTICQPHHYKKYFLILFIAAISFLFVCHTKISHKRMPLLIIACLLLYLFIGCLILSKRSFHIQRIGKTLSVFISLLFLSSILLLTARMASLKLLVNAPYFQPFCKWLVGDEYNNFYDADLTSEKRAKIAVSIDPTAKDSLVDYYNVVLLGLDSRNESLSGRRSDTNKGKMLSDTIIIASFGLKSGEIKLTSVSRDLILQVDDSLRKCNSAYAFDGACSTITTLNKNLDLNIDNYVTVNLAGMYKIIDLFGGIDMNITDDEVEYINKYIKDMNKSMKLNGSPLNSSGSVHMDGIQATAFCRIRYTPFTDSDGKVYRDDFGRQARQQAVLECLFKRIKNTGITDMITLIKDVFALNKGEEQYILTSIPFDDALQLIPIVSNFNIKKTAGFPNTKNPDAKVNGASSVVAKTLASNVIWLHELLFGQNNYQPSSVVEEISNLIIERTGVK